MENLIDLAKKQNEESYLFGLQDAFKNFERFGYQKGMDLLKFKINRQKDYIEEHFNN